LHCEPVKEREMQTNVGLLESVTKLLHVESVKGDRGETGHAPNTCCEYRIDWSDPDYIDLERARERERESEGERLNWKGNEKKPSK
jgi:hypothetical protein